SSWLLTSCFCSYLDCAHPVLHPFPTRRSSDFIRAADEIGMIVIVSFLYQGQAHRLKDGRAVRNAVKTACAVLRNINRSNVIIEVDRKSTRLNSSHVKISYAVFCLKKNNLDHT